MRFSTPKRDGSGNELPAVDYLEIHKILQDPKMIASDWSAHCGCVHKHGAPDVIRCKEHAEP